MGLTILQPRCMLGALTSGTVALSAPASASLIAEESFVYDNDTPIAGATGGAGSPRVRQPQDEIRVVTSFTDVVPEPTCAASAFVAGAALFLRARRSST